MVKEGYWYGLPLVAISGALIGLGLYKFGGAFLLTAGLIFNFFRDPDRAIPSHPLALVSPADGRVVQVVKEIFRGQEAWRISIFMSPLDAHVNRSPIAGTIQEVAYRKGSFRVAFEPRASVENEQNFFVIEGEQGKVAVKQIAGVLARRIVFWRRPGDRVARGERVGLIKFGSRVDVVIQPEVELRVKVGDHVRAGSSILGITRPRAEARS